MKNLTKIALIVSVIALGSALAPRIHADAWDQLTTMTFSAPVEIPGQVLPAGSYVFKLMESQSDRNIVQIFNKNQTKLYATILAIPDYRLKPTGKTVITFEERASDSPEAIKAWFYPGDNYGQEFVYPKPRAVQLAKIVKQPVPSMPANLEANTKMAAKAPAEPHVMAIKKAPVRAQQPTGEEVETVDIFPVPPQLLAQNTAPAQPLAPKKLPATASTLPLVALLGLMLASAGFLLRFVARRLYARLGLLHLWRQRGASVRPVVLLMTGLRRIAGPRGVVLAQACVLACCARELGAQADFQVDVSLVVLHVTVADHQGSVPELPKAAFQVYEDGLPQNLTLFRHEDTPVAVGLVVDNSGSMRRKLPEVVAAAAAFAQASNPEDQMFVVNFNEHVSLDLPEAKAFVSDPEELRAAMLQIHAKGETALYDAVATALDHIRKSLLRKKVLIVLSDGGDNSSTRRFPEVLSMLQQSDIIAYTVGLFDEYDKDRNPGVLKQLAKVSGGEAFFPKEVPDVTNVLQTVSRDIRHQYTIGYVPTNSKRDGTYRHVLVKLTGPHTDRWIVRTRTGYFAGAPDAAASEPQKAKKR